MQKRCLFEFRVHYEHVETKRSFQDILIEAENLSDAAVLAKYRIEIHTSKEFMVKCVVPESSWIRPMRRMPRILDLQEKDVFGLCAR